MKRNLLFKIGFTVLILSVLVLFLSIESCQKDKPVVYRDGVVSCLIQDTTSIRTAFNFFNSLGLSINYLGDFGHIAVAGRDSLAYYTDTLTKKKYLTFPKFTVIKNTYTQISQRDSVIALYLIFNNLSQTELNDWFNSIKSLKIFEIPSLIMIGKDGLINVPIGKEDYYVKQLPQYPIIRSCRRIAN